MGMREMTCQGGLCTHELLHILTCLKFQEQTDFHIVYSWLKGHRLP